MAWHPPCLGWYNSVFMRKTFPVLVLISGLTLSAKAQILSEFTWNSGSVTHADIGSDATLGAGSTATAAPGGVGGTDGVKPNGNNINLVVPGAEFEVAGLDISEDFIRKENTASFFTLGGMDFGISTGAIYAKFLLNKSGADTAISLANFLSVPTDANFHNYRFVYDNVLGTFKAYLDGALQYTYTGKAGRQLSWTGATNAIIGSGMDGSGATFPILDNFIAQTPPVVLPLQLYSFDAVNAHGVNQLTWSAARDQAQSEFTIERSTDGTQFIAIGRGLLLPGVPSATATYQYIDNTPPSIAYYRLRMTNTDGTFSYSSVRKVSNAPGGAISITCYPNPVINHANVKINNATPSTYYFTVATLDGRILQSGALESRNADQQLNLDLSTAPKGIVMISLRTTGGAVQTFKMLKQ